MASATTMVVLSPGSALMLSPMIVPAIMARIEGSDSATASPLRRCSIMAAVLGPQGEDRLARQRDAEDRAEQVGDDADEDHGRRREQDGLPHAEEPCGHGGE